MKGHCYNCIRIVSLPILHGKEIKSPIMTVTCPNSRYNEVYHMTSRLGVK